VHIQFGKRLLGVKLSSQNSAVLWKLGRYPLKVVYFFQMYKLSVTNTGDAR
jgi:hypothetical protein